MSEEARPLPHGSLLLVGESPPVGSPPDFRPFDCDSGTRLASVLGLVDRETLLRHIHLANLFASPCGVKGGDLLWVDDAARQSAHRLVWAGATGITERPTVRAVVAFGRRVADAFGLPTADDKGDRPAPAVLTTWRYYSTGPVVTYAPHPSGASSVMNSGDVRTDVRRALLPELVLGCPSLRPWHFRLGDPAVLYDLAVAVAPTCPAVGAAALRWADAQHTAWRARYASPLLASVDAALSSTTSPSPRRVHSEGDWDHGLELLMWRLARPNGARELAEVWTRARETNPEHARLKDRFLIRAAEDHHDFLTAYASRSVIRATTLRYMLAAADPLPPSTFPPLSTYPPRRGSATEEGNT